MAIIGLESCAYGNANDSTTDDVRLKIAPIDPFGDPTSGLDAPISTLEAAYEEPTAITETLDMHLTPDMKDFTPDELALFAAMTRNGETTTSAAVEVIIYSRFENC